MKLTQEDINLIENFIIHFTSDDKEREDMSTTLNTTFQEYMEDD